MQPFIFFSDTQPDPETGDFTGVGLMIAEAVELTGKPEVVIFGGDTVNHGGDEAEWAGFWKAVNGSLNGVKTAAVAGNHDNHALLAGQFDLPSAAPAEPGEGWFYSFSAGHVFFIMLDSNIMGAANQADIDWLRAELQSEAAKAAHWRVAVMHHPMWPLSDIPRDLQRAETMREFFLPLLEEFGIDLILCGHQHVYSRTQPMRGDSALADADGNGISSRNGISSGNGIIQVMVASGDKASYAVSERDFLAAGAEAPNYVRITADDGSLTIIAFDSEHEEIDSFVVRK